MTERAGSVGRGTEERPFTETALSACARARRTKARLMRRLARDAGWRQDILIFDPIMAASIKTD
jgi:hypothetical protein